MRRLLAISFLVALAATSCGKGTSNQGLARLDQVGFVSEAAARSEQAGTAKLSMAMQISGVGSGENADLKGDGVMDFVNKVFEVKMDLPSIAGVSGKVEMIVTPDGEYALFPPEMASVMGGKAGKWVHISRPRNGGVDVSGLSNLTDPSKLFDAIKSYSSSVKEVGQTTIRGVSANEYVVTMDKQKLLAKVTGSEKAAFESMPIPQMRVFVSSDNLIRRESMSYSAGGGSFTMTFDIYDYGAPVHISLPKASDVVDMTGALSP